MQVATELEMYRGYIAEDDATIGTNGKRNFHVHGSTLLKYDCVLYLFGNLMHFKHVTDMTIKGRPQKRDLFVDTKRQVIYWQSKKVFINYALCLCRHVRPGRHLVDIACRLLWLGRILRHTPTSTSERSPCASWDRRFLPAWSEPCYNWKAMRSCNMPYSSCNAFNI